VRDAQGLDMKSGYFLVTMIGYCVGLTICEIVVGSFHLAQPAMIYLVPGDSSWSGNVALHEQFMTGMFYFMQITPSCVL
jgi:hypothetical protein